MIRHVLRRLSAAHGSRPVTIDKAAMRLLLNYDYPGNVRELENILEHALIIGQEGPMIPEHLPDYIHRPPSTQPSRTVSVNHSPGEANNNERQRILAALEDHRGHRGNTARALGIDRSTLWRKMKRHHLL